MEFHQGRLFDHVHLRVSDLEASKRFYRAAVEALGLSLTRETNAAFLIDELYISADAEPSRVHIAFQAADRVLCNASTTQRSLPAAATTGRPASATITRATTPPTSSIRTETTSRPSSTARRSAPQTSVIITPA